MERGSAAAESIRQQRELERQDAERARTAAEEMRAAAEDARRAVLGEVHATIAALTTLIERMEVVEALRRDSRS
jgi:hypothetical protein